MVRLLRFTRNDRLFEFSWVSHYSTIASFHFSRSHGVCSHCSIIPSLSASAISNRLMILSLPSRGRVLASSGPFVFPVTAARSGASNPFPFLPVFSSMEDTMDRQPSSVISGIVFTTSRHFSRVFRLSGFSRITLASSSK